MKRYPKYKESGATWLGQVPEHWELGRLGSCVSLRGEKGSDKDFEPLSVTKNGIVPQLETAAKTNDGENRKIVRRGDIAINGRSDRKGSSGLAEMDGSVSLINIILKIDRGLYPKFAHHLIRSVAFQEEFYRWGRGIVADLWSTNYWDLKRIPTALPPIAEQALIANFIDAALAKMDLAISSQERMIELLKERRSAIITKAVTKGLDPKAKMKHSGVPWLGQVPTNWAVIEPKRLMRSCAGGTLIKGRCHDAYSDGLFPAYSASGQDVWVDAFDYEIPGLVLSAVGARCGKTFKAQGKWGVVANTHCLFPSISIDLDFLWYVTNLDGWWETGGSAQPFVKVRDTLSKKWAFPPVNEQNEIVKFLDMTCEEFKKLIDSQISLIELLKERRSAIITQAVTGQIDVR